jgi:hypothetical protein
MSTRTLYINRRDGRARETVDELHRADFDTWGDYWREARRRVAEYNLADPSASYYTSARCCGDWNK